jgi:hypothetical protein
MLKYNELSKILPKVIVDYIGQYNPEHRMKMHDVLEELYEYHNIVLCDYDMCEQPFDKNYGIISRMHFSNSDFHFCCDDCQSYGEWSISYDYRKSRRYSMR